MAQDAADMVTIFSSSTHDAETEADNVLALLEANGIDSILVGPSVLPVSEFQVRVQRKDAEQARQAIQEAEAAGPLAASEAEAETEE
jgi:hypothetical protein